MLTDKTITCRDCGASFEFTVGEQEFYASKGYTNEPSRCSTCRAARRRTQGGGASAGGYGSQMRRERQMFAAVCAQCGKDTEVPFEPRGDRPVYCPDCFDSQRGRSSDRGGRDRW